MFIFRGGESKEEVGVQKVYQTLPSLASKHKLRLAPFVCLLENDRYKSLKLGYFQNNLPAMKPICSKYYTDKWRLNHLLAIRGGMLMKKLGVLIALVFFVVTSVRTSLLAKSKEESDWVVEPEKSIKSIVNNEKGHISASAAMNQYLVTYVQTESELYRCVEFLELLGRQKGKPSEITCFKLQK
jgi:hypothetical protein